LGRFCRQQLGPIGLAGPAAAVGHIELDEHDQVGLRLDDLAGRLAPDQQQGRLAHLDSIDDHGPRIIHAEGDDRAGCDIPALKDARKRALQIDRAGAKRDGGKAGGKIAPAQRNAPGLAQPLDAPEMVEVRRTADRQDAGTQQLVKQGTAPWWDRQPQRP
jgi:hypothetical protein